MSECAAKGSWVEISAVVLRAGQRAPQVPEDTQRVPLEMWVKGFLVHDAVLGEEAEITTQAGRNLKGKVCCICPEYDHSFGTPIPELLAISDEVRR